MFILDTSLAEILENCCVICRIEFLEADEKSVVTRKGLTTLIKFSNIRIDSVLSLYLANADIAMTRSTKMI